MPLNSNLETTYLYYHKGVDILSGILKLYNFNIPDEYYYDSRYIEDIFTANKDNSNISKFPEISVVESELCISYFDDTDFARIIIYVYSDKFRIVFHKLGGVYLHTARMIDYSLSFIHSNNQMLFYTMTSSLNDTTIDKDKFCSLLKNHFESEFPLITKLLLEYIKNEQ